MDRLRVLLGRANRLYIPRCVGMAWRHTRRFGRGNFYWTFAIGLPTVAATWLLHPERKDLGDVIESVQAGLVAAVGAVALVMILNLIRAPVRMQRIADRQLRNSRADNERLRERLRNRPTSANPAISGITINVVNIGDTSAQTEADQIVNALRIAQSQGTTRTRTASGIILPASVSVPMPEKQPSPAPEGEE
jgi:hypothetical protein